MTKKNELYCTFTINDIQEVSFFYNINFDFAELKADDIQVGISHSISIDLEKKIAGVMFGIFYSTEDVNTKLLEYSIIVNFKVPELECITIKEDDKIFIKDENIILNLLNVTVGTLRGALFLKTKGTPLEKFPFPILPASLLSQSINKTLSENNG